MANWASPDDWMAVISGVLDRPESYGLTSCVASMRTVVLALVPILEASSFDLCMTITIQAQSNEHRMSQEPCPNAHEH